MRNATRHKTAHSPKSYERLTALFPLRPLHDEVDYDNALEIAGGLVGLAKTSNDQADYLDVLTDIIQKYEAQNHAINGTNSPIETLRHMLDEHGMNASDLGRLLGNRALGSAILREERRLSKAHIRALATFFKVSTDLFIE